MRTDELLRELVALPSVNPAFLPPGDERAGEQRITDFLSHRARKAGLEVSLQRVFPGRSNLLARLTPAGRPVSRVILAPHLDTVNGEDEQFRPRVAGGRLYGRGACDTKGSVAAMFTALCELAQARRRPAQTELVFAGLVDEENAQGGSRALAASGLRADLAIVGEPTRLQVVTAHKGSLWLRLETRGKSAHGACPELGRNAVHEMARVVDVLESAYARQLWRRRHPLLGPATVSVGAISGGTQANIVPDECHILVDRRTLPGESELAVRREIQRLMRKSGLKPRFSNAKLAPCMPLETNPRLPLVARFLRAAGQRQGKGVHFFCDAAVLAAAGIPSVVFGAGDIAQAHTADEWISLAAVQRARDLLLRFLSALP